MSVGNRRVTQKLIAPLGMCMLGTVGTMLPMTTVADAKPPVIMRGIPGSAASSELNLAYLATFPNGSLDRSLDKLNAGPMLPGDPLIPDSDPTVTAAPGEVILSIHRPIGLSPDDIPSESVFTPVEFGPGSVVRLRATFVAPVGPYATTGGFAIGVGARTGSKDDLQTETRVFATVNARPNQVVRLQVPFGAVEPTNMALPADVKNAIFSTTDPQPFTIELTINRKNGSGTVKLTVIDQVFTLPSFKFAEFLADGGPTITAVGPGIAVNSNGPGQTASVHLREFRIYTNGGG